MVPDLGIILGLALLPALGNVGGGLLAEWLGPSRATLNLALHLAAGIIVAVIAVAVMPEALSVLPTWLLAGAFLAGGGAYVALESGIERWQSRQKQSAGTGAWMTYVAVAADLIGDGLLIGAGTAVSVQFGLMLAVGQVLADIPEGFAVVANFRDKGVGRAGRILLSLSFILPVVGAAMLAWLFLRGEGPQLKMACLVFVAGLFVIAAVEDMLREAHSSSEDTRWSAFCFLIGFALFVMVSRGLASG